MCVVDWSILLGFARVLFDWPVLGSLTILTTLLLFGRDLKALMARLAKLEFMGGKLEATQSARVAAPTTSLDSPDGSDSAPFPENQPDANLIATRIWEYRYLNQFLVVQTQLVLDWLSSNERAIPLEAYNAFWSARITGSGERWAILQALEHHGLIAMPGSEVRITDKGKEYVGWDERRNYLDQLAKAIVAAQVQQNAGSGRAGRVD